MSPFDLVFTWDVALLRLVNTSGSLWLDPWMARLSGWQAVRWPVVALLALLFLKGRLREKVLVLFGAAAILLGDAGLCQPLKRLVARPRPYLAFSGLRVVGLGGVVISPIPGVHNASMPSSHAFNLAVLAVLLSVFYGGWAHLGWLFAALVGYSRLYTGAHYPADVLAGLALGLAWGLAAIALGRRLWSALGPRLRPAWHESHPELLPPPPPAP